MASSALWTRQNPKTSLFRYFDAFIRPFLGPKPRPNRMISSKLLGINDFFMTFRALFGHFTTFRPFSEIYMRFYSTRFSEYEILEDRF